MNSRRSFSHLAGGLLLALCLLTIVSWAVSCRRAYVMGFLLQNGIAFNVRAQRQDLMFQGARVTPPYRPDRPRIIIAFRPLPRVPRSVGFEFEYIPTDRGGPQLSIGTPHWFFVLLTGVFPAWHFPRS